MVGISAMLCWNHDWVINRVALVARRGGGIAPGAQVLSHSVVFLSDLLNYVVVHIDVLGFQHVGYLGRGVLARRQGGWL